eukprot:13482530-Heterocapsa_arctica.AAC.1
MGFGCRGGAGEECDAEHSRAQPVSSSLRPSSHHDDRPRGRGPHRGGPGRRAARVFAACSPNSRNRRPGICGGHRKGPVGASGAHAHEAGHRAPEAHLRRA